MVKVSPNFENNLFSIAPETDIGLHWTSIRNEIWQAVKHHEDPYILVSAYSAIGANIIFSCNGGKKAYAHGTVLKNIPRVKNILDSEENMQDAFGQTIIIVPDTDVDIVNDCLDWIYNGKTTTDQLFEVPPESVALAMKHIFGIVFEEILTIGPNAACHTVTSAASENLTLREIEEERNINCLDDETMPNVCALPRQQEIDDQLLFMTETLYSPINGTVENSSSNANYLSNVDKMINDNAIEPMTILQEPENISVHEWNGEEMRTATTLQNDSNEILMQHVTEESASNKDQQSAPQNSLTTDISSGSILAASTDSLKKTRNEFGKDKNGSIIINAISKKKNLSDSATSNASTFTVTLVTNEESSKLKKSINSTVKGDRKLKAKYNTTGRRTRLQKSNHWFCDFDKSSNPAITAQCSTPMTRSLFRKSIEVKNKRCDKVYGTSSKLDFKSKNKSLSKKQSSKRKQKKFKIKLEPTTKSSTNLDHDKLSCRKSDMMKYPHMVKTHKKPAVDSPSTPSPVSTVCKKSSSSIALNDANDGIKEKIAPEKKCLGEKALDSDLGLKQRMSRAFSQLTTELPRIGEGYMNPLGIKMSSPIKKIQGSAPNPLKNPQDAWFVCPQCTQHIKKEIFWTHFTSMHPLMQIDPNKIQKVPIDRSTDEFQAQSPPAKAQTEAEI